MAQDLTLFLKQLVRRPHQIKALAPSSEALSRQMAAYLPDISGPVVELGAGTGKITRALLEAGVAPQDLSAIEMQPDFLEHLRDTFPEVRICDGRAEHITRFAARGSVRAVVSGLPLLSMPREIKRAILTGTRDVLAPGGLFIQFTYGPKPPIAPAVMQELGMSWTVSPRIWNNLPPARVYAFSFAPAVETAA